MLFVVIFFFFFKRKLINWMNESFVKWVLTHRIFCSPSFMYESKDPTCLWLSFLFWDSVQKMNKSFHSWVTVSIENRSFIDFICDSQQCAKNVCTWSSNPESTPLFIYVWKLWCFKVNAFFLSKLNAWKWTYTPTNTDDDERIFMLIWESNTFNVHQTEPKAQIELWIWIAKEYSESSAEYMMNHMRMFIVKCANLNEAHKSAGMKNKWNTQQKWKIKNKINFKRN